MTKPSGEVSNGYTGPEIDINPGKERGFDQSVQMEQHRVMLARRINRLVNESFINNNNQRHLGDGGPPPNPTGTNVPRVVGGEHPHEWEVILRFEDQNNWDEVLRNLGINNLSANINEARGMLAHAVIRHGYPLRVVYNHSSLTFSRYAGPQQPSDRPNPFV